MRYILVEWPESQQFIGREGCYYCSPTEDGQLDQAMFVPEKEYYKKIGLPYKFSNTATNGELIDLLSQFPRDAQSILVLYQKHFVMKTDVIDWLHKNHFDYRGLIEKGLAIDATGLNVY